MPPRVTQRLLQSNRDDRQYCEICGFGGLGTGTEVSQAEYQLGGALMRAVAGHKTVRYLEHHGPG